MRARLRKARMLSSVGMRRPHATSTGVRLRNPRGQAPSWRLRMSVRLGRRLAEAPLQ